MLPVHVRSSLAAAAQSTRTKDMEKSASPGNTGGCAFLQLRRKLRALVHQDGQHQRQDDKDEAEPLRRLGELGIERLGFAFGKERFRTAGNGARTGRRSCPDCISTITVTARPEISWIIVRISSKVVMVFILS